MHICVASRFLLALFIQFSATSSTNFSLNDSNCSLSFHIKTSYQSNKVRTNFPLKLLGSYNLTCNRTIVSAYYKLTPLAILVIGKYAGANESIKSMIGLNSSRFRFRINQSSTIRLCVLSTDKDDDDDSNNEYRLCRQVHIGINTLDEFWNLPLKIFYSCLASLIGIYYLLLFLRVKWCNGGKRLKSRTSISRLISSDDKHDTFENEKVHQDDDVDEDEDEE
jgi:hypothetical protein